MTVCEECMSPLELDEHEVCRSCIDHFSTWDRAESDYIDDLRESRMLS